MKRVDFDEISFRNIGGSRQWRSEKKISGGAEVTHENVSPPGAGSQPGEIFLHYKECNIKIEKLEIFDIFCRNYEIYAEICIVDQKSNY